MLRKFPLLIIVVLTACTTAPTATLEQGGLNDDQYVATDARLRIVNSAGISPSSIPGEVDPNRITCAEPSPDVATVIANSFGSSFNLFGSGNTTISSAHVEGLVQLGERTATIQLLRDKMYQTCLAYANGAISGTTYSFIMSRLDDTIVTLLMSETAGGAFGRKLAVVGGKADVSTSATLSSLPGDIANLEERIAATTIAEQELRTAEGNLATHKELTVIEEKKEAHDARTKELEGIVNDARNKRDAAQRLMKDTMETATNSVAGISEIEGGGGLTITPDPLIAATLADMQAEFLLQDASSSIVTACLVEMGRKFGGQKDHSMAEEAISIYLDNMRPRDSKGVRAAEAVEAIAIQAADRARERAKEALAKIAVAVEGATDIQLANAAAVEAANAVQAAEAVEMSAIRAADSARNKSKEAFAKVTAAVEGATAIELAKAAAAEAGSAVEAAEAAEAAAVQSADRARERVEAALAKVAAAAEGAADNELAKAAAAEASKAVEAAEALEAAARLSADHAREGAKEADAKVTAATEGAADIGLAEAAAVEAAKAAEVAEALEAAAVRAADSARERAKEADAKVTAAAAGATDIELAKTAAAEAAKAVDAAEVLEAAAIQAARSMIAEGTDGGGVGAKRVTGSVLADYCQDNLERIILESSKFHDKFRSNRAALRAKVDEKKYGARFAAAAADANKTFVAAIKECETVKEPELRKACLKKLFDVPN